MLIGDVVEGVEVLPLSLQAVSRISMVSGRRLGSVLSPPPAAFGLGRGSADVPDGGHGVSLEPPWELVSHIRAALHSMPASALESLADHFALPNGESGEIRP